MEPLRQNARHSWKRGLMLAGAAIGAGVLLSSRKRSSYSFRGRSVLITGGSRGLGLEMARHFASEGANISILARTQTALETARAELEEIGARVLAIPCDVRDRSQAEEAVSHVIARYGRLDVLVNNAGVIQVAPLAAMTLDDYRNAMDTHAWGSLYLIQAALPHMFRQGSGRIVNISSIGGKVAVPHLGPYSMSKFAQGGMSEALRAEVAKDNILVTTVYPGLMRTGSHVNASFKGQHRSEFAWFSIAASSPVLSMSARRAARQIVEACRRGQAELVLTLPARMAVLAKTLFPGLVSSATQLTTRLLPKNGGERELRSGWESRSKWSPSLLTRLADRAIERNNEFPQEEIPPRAAGL